MKIIITEGQYNIILEAQGISFDVRKWSDFLKQRIEGSKDNKLIINGNEYPDAYRNFSVDEFQIIINRHLPVNSGMYDESKSGFKNGKYIIFLILPKIFSHYTLNHELRHAFEDYKRYKNNGVPLSKTKEYTEILSGDFEKLLTGGEDYGQFKDVFAVLYYTSKIEESAYGETIYDNVDEVIRIVQHYSKLDYTKIRQSRITSIEEYWNKLKEEVHIPILNKFNNYVNFLNWANNRIHRRGEKVLKKLYKIKYYKQTNGFDDSINQPKYKRED